MRLRLIIISWTTCFLASCANIPSKLSGDDAKVYHLLEAAPKWRSITIDPFTSSLESAQQERMNKLVTDFKEISKYPTPTIRKAIVQYLKDHPNKYWRNSDESGKKFYGYNADWESALNIRTLNRFLFALPWPESWPVVAEKDGTLKIEPASTIVRNEFTLDDYVKEFDDFAVKYPRRHRENEPTGATEGVTN